MLPIINGYEKFFHGKENATTAAKLKSGEDCVVYGFGQSMTPIIKNGQPVFVRHITPDMEIRRGDIVFCKVKSYYYLHKVHAVKGETWLIGNNHGHMNGTVGRSAIFGKVEKIF